MKTIIKTTALALICACGATSLAAAPVCSQFASPDTMPKKYRKLAPVINNAADGWIITQDQLLQTFEVNDTVTYLIDEITAEFQKRDILLALLVAPPRPAIAGQDVLDNGQPVTNDYNAEQAATSYSNMVAQLQTTAVVIPDLAKVALSTADMRDAYYFKRDTHWTPLGAARSIEALSLTVANKHPALFATAGQAQAQLLADGPSLVERGSLSDMTKATCEIQLAPEEAAIPLYENASNDLLGDSDDKPRIALAGSSFSNRYKKDFYRVADALAGAFDAEVQNFSVSGGGSIGAIESIVLDGTLKAGDYDMVVWEMPYTDWKNPESFLRQLLGALRFDSQSPTAQSKSLDQSGKVTLEGFDAAPNMVLIHTPNGQAQRMKLDVKSLSGEKETINLVRKSHIPADRRADIWAISLAGKFDNKIASVALRYDPEETVEGANIMLSN